MANGINLEAEGLLALGQLAKQGDDMAEAMRCFEEALSLGSGKAAYTLAYLYEQGSDTAHDLGRAADLYNQAAAAGYQPDDDLTNDPAYRCISLVLSNSGMDADGYLHELPNRAQLLAKMGAGLRGEQERIKALRTVDTFNEDYHLAYIHSVGSSKSEVKEGMRE